MDATEWCKNVPILLYRIAIFCVISYRYLLFSLVVISCHHYTILLNLITHKDEAIYSQNIFNNQH